MLSMAEAELQNMQNKIADEKTQYLRELIKKHVKPISDDLDERIEELAEKLRKRGEPGTDIKSGNGPGPPSSKELEKLSKEMARLLGMRSILRNMVTKLLEEQLGRRITTPVGH